MGKEEQHEIYLDYFVWWLAPGYLTSENYIAEKNCDDFFLYKRCGDGRASWFLSMPKLKCTSFFFIITQVEEAIFSSHGGVYFLVFFFWDNYRNPHFPSIFLLVIFFILKIHYC